MQTLTGFIPCDALISANLSHTVYLPSSALYPELVAGSWALNTRKSPWCFALPSSACEVSQILTALRSAGDGAGDWHIAVRSGGHGSDDSNNIAIGVTIDLSQLNATTYDAATNIASIGTGARWLDVYVELEKYGVSVTGGRQGIVGVGGFVLGGGNSWYTARTGFSCDNVINYEVVLPSGKIINANATAHSDLWRALKGGSSNFGVVTRFDMQAFPARNLTIQTRTIGMDRAKEFVDAFAGFTDLDESFHNNALLSYMSYGPETNETTILVTEVNTVDNTNTTAFDAFNLIPTLVPGTKQSLSLVDSANSSSVAPSTLNAGTYLTIANDRRVLRYCIDQHDILVADLKTILGSEDFWTVVDFQPLPSYFAEIGARNGGNMLGLERDSRNKFMFVAGVTLLTSKGEEQYPRVHQKLSAMITRVEAFSKSVGSNEEFVYLNYAHANENPLGSYGKASVDHIRKVAHKYDPHGFMQKRVPGGFKIDRVK
ncbi:FAD binding domain-containing protein [Polychaeton citri CBS 116435]|uniref:FAD binding domain-containing protein n=1 Tax=Polychaeton citri CBS 116435 TaxID=1314669 RepID=A0A9P4UQ14_9PEZI|nr:FAD binding domain-containing protein [Polychaeton citri CBS 116435]